MANVAAAEVIAAARGLAAVIEIIDSGMTVLPFGTEAAVYDRAARRLQDAVATLDATEQEATDG